MNSFLGRLSLVLPLMMLSSCTLHITQVQFPNETDKPEIGFEVIPETMSEIESDAEPSSLDRLKDTSEVEVDAVDQTQDEVVCGQFKFPDIEEIPEFPFIPPSRRNDDEYVSEQLVEHVNNLTTFIATADKKITTAYQNYLDNCR